MGLKEEIQPTAKALERAGGMVKQVALWMAETCFPLWRSRSLLHRLLPWVLKYMLGSLTMSNNDLKQEEKHV